MRLKKLQLVIDEQSPMRIKPDSLTFLVKRKQLQRYVLLNHPQTLRGWHTKRHTFHSEIGAHSVLRVADEVLRTREVVNKTADTLPKFQTEYMFIRTVAESKTQPCITFVETRSRVVITFVCARKGGYEDLTKEILRHFEAYGFLNAAIFQCDKEMSIIDVCRKSCTRTKRENCVEIRAKNKSSERRVCRSSARTHSGTRTMLPNTNRDEHWHAAFSNFTCHSICDALRWICALKIHSAARRQNPTPTFARNSVCVTFVHVW